jgi:hypothetical protein
LFTVGAQQVNTSQTAGNKMQCVWGVCRGKVISYLLFKIYFLSPPKKTYRICFIIFGNCMRPLYNYSVTESKVGDIINSVNNMTLLLEDHCSVTKDASSQLVWW